MEAALEKLLVEKGGIPAERLDEAQRLTSAHGGRLDTYLLEFGLIDEAQLTDLLARAYDLQPADFRALVKVDLQALKTIPSRVAERCQVFPFQLDGSDLHVLVPAPPDLALLEEIGAMVSRRLVPHLATEYRIARALAHFYGLPLTNRFVALEHTLEGGGAANADMAPSPGAPIANAPVVVAAANADDLVRPTADRVQWDVAEALARLAAASDRDSVIAIALTYARAFLERVAFFGINAGRAVGWDALGPGVNREQFKGLALSLDAPSALRTVIDSRAPFLGQIARNEVHEELYRALGTRRPRSALLHPILTAGRVIAVLYGDNDRHAIRSSDLADLVAFCGRIGAAFENIILARKRSDGAAAIESAAPPSPLAIATPEPARQLDVFAASVPAAAAIEPTAAPATPGADSVDELVFDTTGEAPDAEEPAAAESPLEAWLNREPTLRAATSLPQAEPSLATVAIDDETVLAAPASETAAPAAATVPAEPPAPTPLVATSGFEPTIVVDTTPDVADETPAPGWEDVVYETLGADGVAAAPPEPPVVVGMDAEVAATDATAVAGVVVGTPIAEANAATPDAAVVAGAAVVAAGAAVADAVAEGDEKVAFDDDDDEVAKPGEEAVVFEEVDAARGTASWTSALAYAIEQGRQGGEAAPAAAAGDEPEQVAFDEIVSEVAAVVTPAADAATHDTVVDLKPIAAAAQAAIAAEVAVTAPAETTPAETAPAETALEIGTPRESAADTPTPLSDLDLRHLCDTVAGPIGPEAQAAAERLLGADARIIPMLSSRFPGRVRFDPFGQDWGLPAPEALSPLIWLLTKRSEVGSAVAFAHLDSHFPALRWFAVYLFARIHEPRAIKSLLPRLHDEEPRIRHLTAEALRCYSADAGFETVIKHLRGRLESPVAEVRRRAIYFLGFFKDLRSVPHLIGCLSAREPELVAESVQALTAITLQTLGPAQKKWVKWWDKNRQRNRIEWLIEGLRHADRNIRYASHLELSAIAHDSFDYNYDGKKGDREKAAKRFEKWWSVERKRMRLEEQ